MARIFLSGQSSEHFHTFWINSLGGAVSPWIYCFEKLNGIAWRALTTYPKIQCSNQGLSLGSSPDSVWPMTSVVTGAMRLSGCKEEWRRSRRMRAEFERAEPAGTSTFLSGPSACGPGWCSPAAALPGPGPAKALCHFWNWQTLLNKVRLCIVILEKNLYSIIFFRNVWLSLLSSPKPFNFVPFLKFSVESESW